MKPVRAREMMQDAKRKGRADYWKDLEPVLVEKENGGGSVCMLKCIKEGGVCGKLLSIQNPARTALDHFKEKACRGVRQANGQALLAQQVEGAVGEKRPSSDLGGEVGQTSNSKYV